MKNIEGASELHFITSKNPNIIKLGGEVAIIRSLSICFIKRSLTGEGKLISEH